MCHPAPAKAHLTYSQERLSNKGCELESPWSTRSWHTQNWGFKSHHYSPTHAKSWSNPRQAPGAVGRDITEVTAPTNDLQGSPVTSSGNKTVSGSRTECASLGEMNSGF